MYTYIHTYICVCVCDCVCSFHDHLQEIMEETPEAEAEVYGKILLYMKHDIIKSSSIDKIKKWIVFRLEMDGYDAHLCNTSWFTPFGPPSGTRSLISLLNFSLYNFISCTISWLLSCFFFFLISFQFFNLEVSMNMLMWWWGTKSTAAMRRWD